MTNEQSVYTKVKEVFREYDVVRFSDISKDYDANKIVYDATYTRDHILVLDRSSNCDIFEEMKVPVVVCHHSIIVGIHDVNHIILANKAELLRIFYSDDVCIVCYVKQNGRDFHSCCRCQASICQDCMTRLEKCPKCRSTFVK